MELAIVEYVEYLWPDRIIRGGMIVPRPLLSECLNNRESEQKYSEK